MVILEELELFVTLHKNQMLLYILSDAVLANSTPVALVGLTSCLVRLVLVDYHLLVRDYIMSGSGSVPPPPSL